MSDMHYPSYSRTIFSSGNISVNALFNAKQSWRGEELLGTMIIEMTISHSEGIQSDHLILIMEEDVKNPTAVYLRKISNISTLFSDISNALFKEEGKVSTF